MKIARFLDEDQRIRYGWIYGDKVGLIYGSPFGEYKREEANLNLADLQLLYPVQPGKIICVGRNYTAHAKEHGEEVPDLPLIFLKPPSSLIDPAKPIVLPPQSQQVEHEAELVIVFAKRGRWISINDAMSYIFGYTIGNDVTARDLQNKDGQWTRAKGFDTFCPLGPWIETDFDPSDAMITCRVNDTLRQMTSTKDMIFRPRQLIAYVSSIMTIEPGDILFTGTPAGVSPLHPGDLVEITIDDIGTLCNPVISESNR